jgi:hypothetical protein
MADDHRRFAPTAQLVEDLRAVPPTARLVMSVTTTRAGKCRMFVGTARLAAG